MNPPRPLWQRALTWPARRALRWWRSQRAGRWQGWAQPRWWPAARPWPWGLRHPHDGRQVTIFVAGREHVFVPVTYGRYRGHRCDGHLRPTAAEVSAHLAGQGLDPSAGPLLAAISRLEGGFDAVQTYDRARFSWGFIQFAGTGGLPRLLLRLKAQAPEAWAAYFAPARLDVTSAGVLLVGAARGWRTLTRLHDEPALWKVFVLAGHDPAVQAVQVGAAYEHYLLPARALTVGLGGREVALGLLLGPHPLGEAALVDHAVHRGLAYTRRLFQRAARQVGRPDPAALLAAARALEPGDAERWAALERALTEPKT